MFEAMFKDSLPAQPSRIQMKPPPTPPNPSSPVSSRVSPENTLLPLGSSSSCSVCTQELCSRFLERVSEATSTEKSKLFKFQECQYLSYDKEFGVQNCLASYCKKKKDITNNVYFNLCSQICFLDQPKPNQISILDSGRIWPPPCNWKCLL